MPSAEWSKTRSRAPLTASDEATLLRAIAGARRRLTRRLGRSLRVAEELARIEAGLRSGEVAPALCFAGRPKAAEAIAVLTPYLEAADRAAGAQLVWARARTHAERARERRNLVRALARLSRRFTTLGLSTSLLSALEAALGRRADELAAYEAERASLIRRARRRAVRPRREALAAALERERERYGDVLREAGEAAAARALLDRLSAELAAANRGLVAKEARRHAGRGLDYEDLLQEGTRGLMEAMARFDPARGCRFSTIATPWVKKKIVEAIESQARTVRIPRHVHDRAAEVARTRRRLEAESGREPAPDEIAAALGVGSDRVELALAATREVASLDAPIVLDGETTRADLLPAAEAHDPYRRLEAEERREILARALASLTPRQAEVLRLRYGMGEEGMPLTAPEVARALAVSESRVRAVEARALERLRRDPLLTALGN